MLWPERPRRTARRWNFRFARCRARGSASIAKYVLFCPQVKFNNINLPPEAERWLQIAHSRLPLPPPLHAICFPFLTRTLCSSARFPPFLTCMSFPQFNSRPFSLSPGLDRHPRHRASTPRHQGSAFSFLFHCMCMCMSRGF